MPGIDLALSVEVFEKEGILTRMFFLIGLRCVAAYTTPEGTQEKKANENRGFVYNICYFA